MYLIACIKLVKLIIKKYAFYVICFIIILFIKLLAKLLYALFSLSVRLSVLLVQP